VDHVIQLLIPGRGGHTCS